MTRTDMARRKRHEEHDNHEAWAIPYGDLVTLLLAFFVVMYAMSSVNEGKYRVLSDSLSEAFNGTARPTHSSMDQDPPPRSLELPRAQVRRLISAALPATANAATSHAPAPAATPAAVAAASPAAAPAPAPAPASDAAADSGASVASAAELQRVADQVSGAMGALVAAGEVHVRRYQNWVAVDISTDILFGSGIARVSNGAVPAMQHLADALKPFPNAIRVEGHTDDRPIKTSEFPSNWELSAARAASVVHLFMDRGIAPGRLGVMGFGQYRPTGSNATAAGRNANRRVAVMILGSDSAEGRL
ncbi:MAG TPA: flagellar motor protein MotD [Steroidobacteraceae bacterium]